MACGDEPGAEVTGFLQVGLRHSMQLCYTLGTISVAETEWFLIGFDFFFNIYLSLKIVWVKNRRPEDIDEQINLIQQLAISELTEFIAPLSFMIAFIFGYYGPNGQLIGNIAATIWQYEAIEDVLGFLKTVLIFFFVDFGSTIVTSIILWIYCKINLFTAIIAMEKEYGTTICILLCFFLTTVSS